MNSPTDLKILDPACGSGHLLVYAFDLLVKIYEEEGYQPSEIPGLILTHNLYGIDLDPRAASLASFALAMKARAYSRRFFRKKIEPQIIALTDIRFEGHELHSLQSSLGADLFSGPVIETLKQFEQASNYGSLIRPELKQIRPDLLARIDKQLSGDLFQQDLLKRARLALIQADYLSPRYQIVVANPPYMGGGGMNADLKKYLGKEYKDSKSDLMTAFMERSLDLLTEGGAVAMINLPSWMFLSSYEKLREKLLENTFFSSLVHNGRGVFGSDFGSVSFVLEKGKSNGREGVYRRLFTEHVKVDGNEEKERRFLDKDYGYHLADQRDFAKIPGSPIAYWVSERVVKIFEEGERLGDKFLPKQGLSTTNNALFLKYWQEISIKKLGIGTRDRIETKTLEFKWYPYHKGGAFRKWFGNHEYVLNWEDDGRAIHKYLNLPFEFNGAPLRGKNYLFKRGSTWSSLTSGFFGIRFSDWGFCFDAKGPLLIPKDYGKEWFIIGFLNSNVASHFFYFLSPTLDFNQGPVGKQPILWPDREDKIKVDNWVQVSINISRHDWDAHETSWDFERSELLVKKSEVRSQRSDGMEEGKLEEAYADYQQRWAAQFFRLHALEEELNRIFIELYGLEEELTPEVALKDVTILQGDIERKESLAVLDALVQAIPLPERAAWAQEEAVPLPPALAQLSLPFKHDELMRQLLSYAVGCMFGRYSLDKPGLILANQGEDLEDYVKKITERRGESQFAPTEESQFASTKESQFASTEESQFASTEESQFAPTEASTFLPDDDNVIPVLDGDWFADDIVGTLKAWLRAAFGERHYEDNLRYLEKMLGKDLRKYFVKDFYPDHLRRYKKRPIYWMFSSPKGSFQALIYLHRYRPDTVSRLLNEYLRPYQDKLRARRAELAQILSGEASASDQAIARKEDASHAKVLDELSTWERDVIYPLAGQRIELDLDDGVKVNYAKFAGAVVKVKGLDG